MRRIRRAAAAVAVVGALSGCSVYEDLTTSDFAKQDADAIAAAAGKAMQGVTSMRLTGPVRAKGHQVFVDVKLDQDESCTGTMRIGGSHIDIRRVGEKAWIKGEEGAFNRMSDTPLPDATLRELSSTWLPVTDRSILRFCDLDAYLSSFAVVASAEPAEDGDKDGGKDGGKADGKGGNDDLAGDVPVTVGEETSLDDQKVVTISGNPGGTHEEIVWVLSEAPHYVVKMESTSARDGASLALSEFNEDVVVEEPDPKDVIRP